MIQLFTNIVLLLAGVAILASCWFGLVSSRENARTARTIREIAEREERRKMKEQRDRGW